MKKLMDIMGLNASYGEIFNLNEGWTGRILMDEDLSFEGIVFDNSDEFPYHYDYIIGKIKESPTPVTIDLIKATEDDQRLPFRYTVSVENGSFYGDYFVMSEDQSFACGEAKINMLDGDKIREVRDDEIEKVRTAIEETKSKLGSISKKIIAESMGLKRGKVGCKELKKDKSN